MLRRFVWLHHARLISLHLMSVFLPGRSIALSPKESLAAPESENVMFCSLAVRCATLHFGVRRRFCAYCGVAVLTIEK